MQTKANASLFPPGPTTANGAFHLPFEGNLSELLTPLSYSALSLTEVFRLMLISNTSSSHYHQHSKLSQLQHMLPEVGANLYYELLSAP